MIVAACDSCEHPGRKIESLPTRSELYKALCVQGCALIVALTALAAIVAAVAGLLP